MARALLEYQVYGIKTTIPFFQRILLHPRFLSGVYNTHFIAELEKEADRGDPAEEIAALIAAAIKSGRDAQVGAPPSGLSKESHWKIQGRLESFAKRL
jgi:pyruvate carboxylase